MNSWVTEQTQKSISRFDETMDNLYPESKEYSKNAQSFMDHIYKETNYIEAIKMLDWDHYLPTNASLLDLGCGIGWVSAYLSKNKNVSQITCVDSSKYFVNDLLPNVFQYMDANLEKTTSVEGFFSPILLEDDSIDGVVICASIHHADNMEEVLRECYRVLKPGGRLYILNEDPRTAWKYLMLSFRCFIKILWHIIFKKYKSISLSMSYSNILIDPDLGDRAYPVWVMMDMLKASGFKDVVKVDSGYRHSKTSTHADNTPLTHFICTKE
ncbi:MAG: methyltransferase domain-containing protein [Gammaproteobacteria bacterium]|nr:methyltransferase domain-containing protein [Gammaproteobacteria bacterium]